MSSSNNYNGNGRDGNFTITIEQKFGVIAHRQTGWTKEFNLVSWNGNEAKFDIRDWDESHKRMTKGVTFTKEELDKLYGMMKQVCEPAQTLVCDLPECGEAFGSEPQADFCAEDEAFEEVSGAPVN